VIVTNVFRHDYTDVKEFYHFMASDLHFLNAKFDEKRFKKEFDRAMEYDATIDINGDIYDLIFPTDIKRYTRGSDVEPIIDAPVNHAVEYGVEMLRPYVDNIRILGCGNHEVSTIKFNNVDVVKMLVYSLNQIRNPELKKIRLGGYQGFIRNKYSKVGEGRSYGGTVKVDIFYNHGQGGKSEVTKGSIDLERRKNMDADIIWLGHKHQSKIEALDPIIGLTSSDNIYVKEKTGVITGCFLKRWINDYDIEKYGYRIDFESERFRTVSAYGGVLLRVEVKKNGVDMDFIFSRTKESIA